jgi:hypothetical protein
VTPSNQTLAIIITVRDYFSRHATSPPPEPGFHMSNQVDVFSLQILSASSNI